MPSGIYSSGPENRFELLLAYARAGSSQARWQLIQLYRELMLKKAKQELDSDILSKKGASDVVQDAIIEARSDFDQFRGQTEREFLAWLSMIMNNNIRNLIRMYRRRLRDPRLAKELKSDIQCGAPSPSSAVVREEDLAAIREAMEKLSEEYQLVLKLYYDKRLGYEEIAARLGKSQDAVRQIKHRALEILRRDLERRSNS